MAGVGSSSRLSCCCTCCTCRRICHLSSALPRCSGVHRLGRLGSADPGDPWSAQTPQGYNLSLDCLDYCNGYAFLEYLSTTVHLIQILDLGTTDFHLVLEGLKTKHGALT